MVVLTRLGPPEEGVRHKEENTSVYVNEKHLGPGTVYISEARVSWVAATGQGFSLEYPHIAMHAVQRDQSVFPRPNLYLILDVRLVDSDETPTSSTTGSDEEEEAGEQDQGMTEIRFAPEDAARLQSMFDAMSACQALHPDPADNSEDEEEEGEEEGEPHVEGMYDDAEEEDPGPNGGGGDEAMES